MTAEVSSTPQAVPINYSGLECPTTGELCPSRVLIDTLCNTEQDSDNPIAPDQADVAEKDAMKRAAFLVGHNLLINTYGCIAGPIENRCAPSVASNRAPAVRGTKRILKRFLQGNE